MHETARVPYFKGPDYKAVRLPYRNSGLSLLVLLPDRRDGLEDLEWVLSPSMLTACLEVQAQCKVKIYLPRFKITAKSYNLNGLLSQLGMPLAFRSGQADFSGINGRRPPDDDSLFIGRFLHQAFTAANEAGTEAAAASLAAVKGTGRPPEVAPPIPEFRADHPFLFAISDRNTGAILFLGRVSDPTLGP